MSAFSGHHRDQYNHLSKRQTFPFNMRTSKIILSVIILSFLALFFIFDAQQYFSLEYFQSQKDLIIAYKENNFWQTSLMYFSLYVLVACCAEQTTRPNPGCHECPDQQVNWDVASCHYKIIFIFYCPTLVNNDGRKDEDVTEGNNQVGHWGNVWASILIEILERQPFKILVGRTLSFSVELGF